MKIIKASYEIQTPIYGDQIIKSIERYARVCYKSESKITDESAEKMIRHLIQHSHESPLEHVSITVKFICDRGVSHELVRHRIASYSQESTRYCRYKDGLVFVRPCFWNPKSRDMVKWEGMMLAIETLYLSYLNTGSTPEQARAILPNSLKTEVVMTANLREWRHILRLRTAQDAHPQMREIMCPLLEEFKSLIPVVFDDI